MIELNILYVYTVLVVVMKVIPIYIEAGITGFESPAAEYTELGLSLDELLIKHPHATFIGLANGDSMQEAGIFDGDLLIVEEPKQSSTVISSLPITMAHLFANSSINIKDDCYQHLVATLPYKLKKAMNFKLKGSLLAQYAYIVKPKSF